MIDNKHKRGNGSASGCIQPSDAGTVCLFIEVVHSSAPTPRVPASLPSQH
jgi:hypothetical protein